MPNDGFVVRTVSASSGLKKMSVWTTERNHHYIFRPPILSFFQPDRYQGQALGLPRDRKSIEAPVDACPRR